MRPLGVSVLGGGETRIVREEIEFPGVGEVENFDDMEDGDGAASFAEVFANLDFTADIGEGHHIAVGGEDVVGFLLPELVGEFGLIDVVGSGGATASIAFSEGNEFDVGDTKE